jgi:hypothetical protein
MAKKKTIIRKEKRYTIHYISNGFCYRSRCNCPYSYVVEQRRLAKMMGETIEVEYECTITHEYSL